MHSARELISTTSTKYWVEIVFASACARVIADGSSALQAVSAAIAFLEDEESLNAGA